MKNTVWVVKWHKTYAIHFLVKNTVKISFFVKFKF